MMYQKSEKATNDFRNNGMQRWIPGQAAYQAFFNEDGRAFCLYIVIGSYRNRRVLAAEAEKLVRRIRIGSPTQVRPTRLGGTYGPVIE